jgi:hypothetical protein
VLISNVFLYQITEAWWLLMYMKEQHYKFLNSEIDS